MARTVFALSTTSTISRLLLHAVTLTRTKAPAVLLFTPTLLTSSSPVLLSTPPSPSTAPTTTTITTARTELDKMGYKIAAYPLTLLSRAVAAMDEALQDLKAGREVKVFAV